MKRQALLDALKAIAKAEKAQMVVTEGKKHTKVTIGDRVEMVPRHSDVNEQLAKAIIKRMTPPVEKQSDETEGR
jgi:mRNA interferase HicA